jgi:hypothetical protein
VYDPSERRAVSTRLEFVFRQDIQYLFARTCLMSPALILMSPILVPKRRPFYCRYNLRPDSCHPVDLINVGLVGVVSAIDLLVERTVSRAETADGGCRARHRLPHQNGQNVRRGSSGYRARNIMFLESAFSLLPIMGDPAPSSKRCMIAWVGSRR